MDKLYAYVDENGLETNGRIFVVASVVLNTDPELARTACEEMERLSGKGKFKWGKAKHELRMRYLRRIFADKRFRGRLRFAVFQNTKDYDSSTVSAIARSLSIEIEEIEYAAYVYVDALSKTKRRDYMQRLRMLGVSLHDVRGIARDENHALTRLADAIAGFVRDALDEPDGEIGKFFELAKAKGILVEV